MPSGIPVATVALNGAKNAGILAAKIIGSHNQSVQHKVINFQNSLKQKVLASSQEVQETYNK